MARLVIISKDQTGLSHELGAHWVTIGRAPRNSFQILEPSISGHHCEVRLTGDKLEVRDMRSTNGTFIRGTQVTEGEIAVGDSFRVGDVELRLEVSIQPASVYVSCGDQPGASKAGKVASLLLVDDSMAFLETTAELFAVLGNHAWDIHTAPSADKALAVLQQHRVDLAVIDLSMPLLDGGQLLAMLHRRYPDMKKVVLTGNLNESVRASCLAAGAELVLEKPTAADGFKGVFNMLNDLIVWSQREGFSGTLRHVGLAEVIQIQCLGRRSSILEVRDATMRGEIYIESGIIVHAVAGSLIGPKAFYKLLSLTRGLFHLQAFKAPAEKTVEGSWEFLLIEAARVRDEEKQVQSCADTIHVARQPAAQPQPQPSGAPGMDDELVVVSTYDGEWHPVAGQS
jgi:CheY-like chemotaxis protein